MIPEKLGNKQNPNRYYMDPPGKGKETRSKNWEYRRREGRGGDKGRKEENMRKQNAQEGEGQRARTRKELS